MVRLNIIRTIISSNKIIINEVFFSFFVLDEIRADLVSLKVDRALDELRVKFPEKQVLNQLTH